MRFRDRRDAGQRLSEELGRSELNNPVVLALPRGGAPVAFEVARTLDAPLDVFVARKVGAPGQPEFGIGAVAEGGGEVRDERMIALLGLTPPEWADLVRRERQELERRVQRYRGDRPLPCLAGRDVVLVDDGLATGVTAEAALRALRRLDAGRVILAVPVCASETAKRLREIADEIICVQAPTDFAAVGRWYEDFAQTSDEEVLELLGR